MKALGVDHPFLMHLGRQLREAVGAGAALAALGIAGGCGANAEQAADVDGGGGGTESSSIAGSSSGGTNSGGGTENSSIAGSSSGGSSGSTATTPDANLEPYPLDSLGCFGPVNTSPLYGPQCCFAATCYTPTDGSPCVEEPTYGSVALELPLGSGSCGCSVEDQGRPSMAGPYAPNPDAPEPLTPGRCCYVVGSVGCTGRPFVVSGLGRLASVARRDDWGSLIRATSHGAAVGQG